jgi:branched-chain amino acid transport system substrate-binding protein
MALMGAFMASVAPASAFPVKAAPPGTVYQDPGVTDDTIKIGVFGPMSGPAVAYGADNIRLATAWFDMINKAGGIWGRKIDYIVEDDKCTANDTVAAVKKLVEEDKVFMLYGGSCSAAVVAVREYVERNKIPLITLNASADGLAIPPSPYITTALPLSQHAVGGSIIDFATRYLKAKRIAYIRHNDAYGQWNTEAAMLQLKKTDAQIVAMEDIDPAITDMTAPMLRVRAAHPDVILLLSYARPSTLAIKKAYELGLTVPVVLAANGSADLRALSDNVGTKDAFKDFYYQDTINDVPRGPKQKWLYDLWAAKYPDLAAQPGHPTDFFSNSAGSFEMVTYGLMMSGPEPTRENFTKATSNMWFLTGSLAGPEDLTAEDRMGNKTSIFLKFDGTTRSLVPGQWTSDWRYQADK